MLNKNLELLQNKKIIVLCGGVGGEAEVSLASGSAIFEALQSQKLDVEKLIADGSEEQIMALEADLVFVALHGEFGEDGTVQCLLEKRGIPFTGSGAVASGICIDKNLTKMKFAENDIPVAPWVCVGDTDNLSEKLRDNNVEFPVVVKPNSGGSSVGVYIIKNEEKLASAVTEALKFDSLIMIEKYIEGVELTSSVLEGRALPLIELKAAEEFYDYHAKYEADTTVYECPPQSVSARVLEECSAYSVKIFEDLDLQDMVRVDYIVTCCGDIVALEINTIPGFTSHSLLPKAAQKVGIDFVALCVEIAAMAWKRSVA